MSPFRVNTNVMAMNALRNLGTNGASYAQSVTRLSTGLRINSGADDPAGLQISEGFRSQISGLGAALRNNQDAINFAKTAEGALNEVSTLLRDARGLIIANGNDATLSASQKQANQNQLNSILQSIDRIASQTQFGTKKLLNGAAGITSTVTNKNALASVSFSGTYTTAGGTSTLTANDNLTVDVTTAAVRANAAGNVAYATGVTTIGAAGRVSINGVSFDVTAGMTRDSVVSLLNSRSADTGVTVDINGANQFRFTANSYGTNGNSIRVTTDTANLLFSAAGTTSLTAGANAAATIGLNTAAVTLTGFTVDPSDGLTFRDGNGNQISLTNLGGASINNPGQVAAIRAGAAQFQVGANAGQTANLSLNNSSSSALGLVNLDITTAAGATSALTLLENAIEGVASRRGEIGSFMRNILESNVRTLGIARENITASESSIRDTDVAEEMTQFTKMQIMQQAGMSVLAQANQAPQGVLSLLRG